MDAFFRKQGFSMYYARMSISIKGAESKTQNVKTGGKQKL